MKKGNINISIPKVMKISKWYRKNVPGTFWKIRYVFWDKKIRKMRNFCNPYFLFFDLSYVDIFCLSLFIYALLYVISCIFLKIGIKIFETNIKILLNLSCTFYPITQLFA